MNRSRLHNSTEHTMHSCGHGSLSISHSDAWHRVECIPFTANVLSDCERRDLCAAAVRMRFGERIVRPHPRHGDGKMFACRLNRTIRKARIDQINGKTSSSALNLGRFVFYLQMQIPLNFRCAVRTSSDFTRKQKVQQQKPKMQLIPFNEVVENARKCPPMSKTRQNALVTDSGVGFVFGRDFFVLIFGRVSHPSVQ